MQKGFNQVILTGNLASDPEVRDMPNGNKAATLSVVTSTSWKDKETQEIKENPQFHRVVGFGHTANFSEYLKKGQLVQIVGMLTHRKYQNNEGKDVYITEVLVNPMEGGMLQSLGPRKDGGQAAPASGQQQAAPQQAAPQQAAPQEPAQAAPQQAAPQPQQTPPIDDDDDIPF